MSESLVERVVLLHVEGPRSGEVDSFCQPTVVIGRAPDCHLVFPTERGVSGHHAVIRLLDGVVELEDTRSTNGTFVNDVRVDRCALKHEDTIRLGSIGPLLKIELPDRERAHMPLAPTPPPTPREREPSPPPPPARVEVQPTQQAMPPAPPPPPPPRPRSTTPHTPLEAPAGVRPRVAMPAAMGQGMSPQPPKMAWAILGIVFVLEIVTGIAWVLLKLRG
jgi:hypothetical protein